MRAFSWLAVGLVVLLASIATVRRLAALATGDKKALPRLYISLVLGGLMGAAGITLEAYFAHFTGIDLREQSLGDWASLFALLAIFAPLEEALKLLAFLPAYRLRWIQGRRGALFHATALALGYAAVDTAFYLRGVTFGPLPLFRALLALPTHVFAAGVWAYALGRGRALGKSEDRVFFIAWLGAATVHGLYIHLLFGRGVATIFAVLPLLAAMIVVGYFFIRPLWLTAPASLQPQSLRILSALPPPPSLRSVRAALRRAERRATLRWVTLGAFVTIGAMIASVAGAVILSQRLGIDFSVVDEGEITSTIPLLILGSAVLAAFPFSGFLVARASSTGSVLEPAMGAGLAIFGSLLLLGLAAPIAVVFGLAFAPVAFVLACAGAWIGMGG